MIASQPPISAISTSAGYLTPTARPASSPATIAAPADGRSSSRVQARMAAAPKAASTTSLSGADIPLEIAGASSTIAPAHQARGPEARAGHRGHARRQGEPQEPGDPSAGHGPAEFERDGVEQLGRQRIDGLVQVGVEPGGVPHQEDLGHLEVIAERIAVGHRRGRDHRRAQQADRQQCRDDPAGRRRGTLALTFNTSDGPSADFAERPQRRADAQLDGDGQQHRQAR